MILPMPFRPCPTTRLVLMGFDRTICSFCNCIFLLTQLLQAIERGATWHSPTNIARTAFLSKGDDDLSPQGFRGLAILSKLYRMWASIRLRHLKEWIGS